MVDCIISYLYRCSEKIRRTTKLPYVEVLEWFDNNPSWPPLSPAKMSENTTTDDNNDQEKRESRLQLENVEILDEGYAYNKYFGLSNERAIDDFPTVSFMQALTSQILCIITYMIYIYIHTYSHCVLQLGFLQAYIP